MVMDLARLVPRALVVLPLFAFFGFLALGLVMVIVMARDGSGGVLSRR